MKQLEVLGKVIKIRKQKNLMSEHRCYGNYDPRIKTITVDASLKGKVLVQTILHEVFHAYCDIANFHQMPCWSVNIEELIAEGFTDFLNEKFNVSMKK